MLVGYRSMENIKVLKPEFHSLSRGYVYFLDSPLDFGNDSVITGCHCGGCHESKSDANGLTLGSANHDLFVQLDTVVIPRRNSKNHLNMRSSLLTRA